MTLTTPRPFLIGAPAFAALTLAVVGSNLAIERFGIVPVGFGLRAPAAVYVVGLALIARDLVHTHLGRLAAGGAVILGAVLTLAVAPGLAVASAAAYLVSELVDLAIFDLSVRRRSWLFAVAASSLVGLVVDSVVFLGLAPGLGMELLPGQIVGKGIAVAAAVTVLALLSTRRQTEA